MTSYDNFKEVVSGRIHTHSHVNIPLTYIHMLFLFKLLGHISSTPRPNSFCAPALSVHAYPHRQRN
jgi:hypothetical protein